MSDIDQDRPCPHENFMVNAEVNRLMADHGSKEVVGFSVSLWVICSQCDEPFRWTGVPAGLSPSKPTCSPDETELRAPIRPASADPDFGIGLPGFSINYVVPDER